MAGLPIYETIVPAGRSWKTASHLGHIYYVSEGRLKSTFRLVALLALLSMISVGQSAPVALDAGVKAPFSFVAYGDIRFMETSNIKDSDPIRRKILVQKIAGEKPAFLLITGDLVANGGVAQQWSVFDNESSPFQAAGVKLYPALGNHDLRGDLPVALKNYFQRFPYLQQNRYYSVRADNVMVLTLDSSLDHPGGPEMQWFERQIDALPDGIQFVVVQLHHPPLTRSTDSVFGGGHAPRAVEQDMAGFLESKAAKSKAKFIVVAGHVHNYERYERNGVMYIVTGGGGATPYMIQRQSNDAYKDIGASYHYCHFDVKPGQIEMHMVKLDLLGNKPTWQDRDSFKWTAK
jgi:acid phosphatase type 7